MFEVHQQFGLSMPCISVIDKLLSWKKKTQIVVVFKLVAVARNE
jgi:hypothetical protein